jgi:hypothetical protein
VAGNDRRAPRPASPLAHDGRSSPIERRETDGLSRRGLAADDGPGASGWRLQQPCGAVAILSESGMPIGTGRDIREAGDTVNASLLPPIPRGAARIGRRRALLLLGGLALAACSRPKRYSQPEPGFLRLHADDVFAAFATAGLAVTQIQPRPIATATPNPDIPRQPRIAGGPPTEPMVEVEARTFVIPKLGDKGGQLFIFDSEERLRAKRIWFARYPDLYPYVYVYENVLLKLDRSLPPDDADRYRAALEALPSDG